MQASAVQNERGIPPNIKPPRNRWEVDRGVNMSRQWFGVEVHRQRYADLKGSYTGGALVHGWWSWQIIIILPRTVYHVWRWRERWAD